MGACVSRHVVKDRERSADEVPPLKKSLYAPETPSSASSAHIPAQTENGLKGASHALTDLLATNNDGDGVAIVAHRWKSVTSHHEGRDADGPTSMHGAASLNALDALGVNVDNGMSHIEDVKAIVKSGVILGTGSFGSVYKGEIQGIPVAVKVLRYRKVDSIRDELLASMSLTHTNLVQTYMAFQHKVVDEKVQYDDDNDDDSPFAEMMAFDVWKGRQPATEDGPQHADWELTMHEDADASEDKDVLECFIVQEYVNLGNLHDLILDGAVSGPRYLKRCLMMALDMARGLAYMHSFKILHLDLKPQNILLSKKRGERPICKIADFGLSRTMASDMATVNTMRCGTAVYAPIEMVMDGRVSPTADVYSLAIMIGEMLTGKLLYSDVTMAQAVVAVVHNGMRPELGDWVPGDLRTLLQNAWSSDRRKRPLAKSLAADIRVIIRNTF